MSALGLVRSRVAHRGASSRSSTRTACAPATILAAILAASLLGAAPAAADDFFAEEHVLNGRVFDPAWNNVFNYTLDLPKFDTAGGSRTLLGYEVDFSINSLYTKTIASNPTANIVGCEASWTMTWKADLNGQLWFPLDQTSGLIDLTQVTGVTRGPFSAAEPPVQELGVGIGLTRSFADADLLAQLTGDGVAPIECTHTLSDLTKSAPQRWPGQPGVFVPDLIDIDMEELRADVTVTYFWTPEPTSLALLGLGIVALLRRR